MDLSDPSSINSSDLDTMGNILTTSTESTSPANELDQTRDEPSLTGENEVTQCQNADGIDMLIMNKSPADSVAEQNVLPHTSSAVADLNICESDDNVEDLWCDTRELVKVETDEDFDVIVKSLETAIVGADKVPTLSPILVPASSVESDCCDPVLLDELVSPPSLSELDVDGSKLQSAVSDTCLESLMDASIITGEFASIADETFEAESAGLFETSDAVTALTDSRPSLFEACDIAETITKDALPLNKDTLLRDEVLDSADDILSNIVTKNVDSAVQIEDGACEEMLEFRDTQNTVEMLNKSLDQQVLMEKSGEIQCEIVEKREETPSEADAIDENVEKTDKSGSEQLIKADEIMEKHETKSDIAIVNIENLTDADLFDKTEEITEDQVNNQVEEDEPEVNSPENKTEEEIMEENINSVPTELTESVIVSSESENKPETQGIEAEISKTSVEVEENQEYLSVKSENVRLEKVSVGLDKVHVLSEESIDNSIVEVNENKQSVTVQGSDDSSPVKMDKLTAEEDITLSPVAPEKCTINSEQSVQFSAPIDKPQVIEDTGTAVSETQSAIVDDQVKLALDSVEKEQSPPKKIKLIREKLYIPPPVSVSTALPSVDTPANVTATVVSSANVTEVNNSETSAESVQQISEDVPESKDQQVVQKPSPLRTRKLKLKRDYEPEQIVVRVEAELIKPEEEMPSVVPEHEPTTSETISDVTVQCETQNVSEEPRVEQEKKIFSERDLKADEEVEQDNKILSERKLKAEEAIDEDIMMVREGELKAEEAIEQDILMVREGELKAEDNKIFSETDLKANDAINTAVENELEVKDTQESIKSTEPVLLEVNLESEVSDARQIEVPEMPVTCAVDVPAAIDNDVPLTEDIREASDAEKASENSESVVDCEEPSAEVMSNSGEPVNQEESPDNSRKSPESVLDCKEPSTEVISNSGEPVNPEESPENSRKSPESVLDCEEPSAGVISNSGEQIKQEESPDYCFQNPENSSKSRESVPHCEEPSAGTISNSGELANPEESVDKCFKSPESLPDCGEPSVESPEQIIPEEKHSAVLETSTEGLPENIVEEYPSAMPETLTEGLPEKIVEENPSAMPETLTEGLPEKIVEENPSAMPETLAAELTEKTVEDNSSAIPETSAAELPEKIVEESVVICEEQFAGSEETTSVAPETISFPVEAKLSILQQMLMKDVVVPTKEKPPATSVVDLPRVEPRKHSETPTDRSEIELAERPDRLIEDELLQAAKAVETRIDASEETDDELKQAAQEAETRDEHTEAPLEATAAEFEDTSVSICEDEIIAVTQALEMERAQENLVETSKTESLLEICTEKTSESDGTKVIDKQPSADAEIACKSALIIEQIRAKVEDNKLKRHIEETISAVAAKKSKSNKDAESTVGRKLKASPKLTEDSTVTIEPIASQSGVENVGKLRISRRKLEEPVLAKSVTITKPLRVEVDDLGNSSMSPSYFSDLPPQRDTENVPKIVIKPIPKPEERSSPKITIKPIIKPCDTVLSPKTSKSKGADDACTPRITIKPIMKPDALKITITKQKMDDTHSILKIYKPDDSELVPKLTIKPIGKSEEMQHSPRITIKPVKPPNQHSPSTSMSPKITVKPVLPPNDHSPKITMKSVVNPEDSYPKVTIKPILRPDDSPRGAMSPRQVKLKTMTFESSSGVTVEPIAPLLQSLDTQMSPLKISVKSFAKMEETLSPKLTIKPITKTCEIVQSEDGSSNPLKLTIKPILKPEESYQSPKITIKPIMKPEKLDQGAEEMDKPERIILKIQKTNLPSPKERAAHSKESRKEPEVKIEAIMHDPDRSQKLDKIKLKLTKEGSHAQIIPSVPSLLTEQFTLKRPLMFSSDACISEKRSKSEFSGTELLHNSDISINLVEPNAKPNPKTISEEVTIVKLDRSSSSVASPLAEHISQSKFKEMLLKIQQKSDITCTPHLEDNSSSSDDVKIVGVGILSGHPLKDPLSIHDESSSQDVVIVNEVINTNPFHNVQIINAHTITEASAQQTPKKRGRPRKNPLEVKPEIKGEDCVEIVRPKRTCRAPPGRTPFAVKERKPRGAGRGRGGRGRGGASPKSPKEPKTPRGKALKEAKALAKLEAAKLAQEVVIDEITIEDSTNDTTPVATPVPPMEEPPVKKEEMAETEVKLAQVSEELLKEPQQHLPPPIAVYEEETRMSADNSRAQTPARQVIAAPHLEGPEESQSSVQSSATTESNKNKKGRLEVCDPDSAVTTVEQIVEYSWGAGGTYMLQEQIAQFLGVKSFKRKYPGLTRRPVEMQERDYIREKGLVSESMCDMGLTAVPSSEILDIMYTDFQEKYEEYRKCMRDKQSKEISNKQKAISLATSQEKNKIDFKERAIRSAANWNVTFNKSRKESRRCCMDLQTFTINFPLGRTQGKAPQKSPVGQYPIALVPGQFTDYYKRYTSNELHYLPLNTVRYGPVMPNQHCTDAGQSDGSQSETDSSSGSDSDSSDDSMSTVEDTPAAGFGKAGMNLSLSTPKAKVH